MHVARGAAVVFTAAAPRAQPAIADLTGSFAAYSPLGGRHLAVLEVEPVAAGTWERAVAAGRLTALSLADWIAVPPPAQQPKRWSSCPYPS